MERNAALRVIDRRQLATDSLCSLSFMETLPVSTLGQDVHTI